MGVKREFFCERERKNLMKICIRVMFMGWSSLIRKGKDNLKLQQLSKILGLFVGWVEFSLIVEEWGKDFILEGRVVEFFIGEQMWEIFEFDFFWYFDIYIQFLI